MCLSQTRKFILLSFPTINSFTFSLQLRHIYNSFPFSLNFAHLSRPFLPIPPLYSFCCQPAGWWLPSKSRQEHICNLHRPNKQLRGKKATKEAGPSCLPFNPLPFSSLLPFPVSAKSQPNKSAISRLCPHQCSVSLIAN